MPAAATPPQAGDACLLAAKTLVSGRGRPYHRELRPEKTMIVTVTSIRLRSLWKYFRLIRFSFKVTLQARKQSGFIRFKNTGWGYMHYTLTTWESITSMQQFARSGAHVKAMKASKELGTEIRTYTYESDAMPAWPEAKKLLHERGKVLTFR